MARGLHRLVGVLALGVAPSVVPSPAAAQRAAAPPEPRLRREALFLTAITAAAASNIVLHYHHAAGDAPRGVDGEDRWLAPDKALHGGGSYALTLVGIDAGIRPWVATLGVCVAGGVFEATQARASGKDAVTNCAGAALAWGTSKLFQRRAAAARARPRTVAAGGG